MVIFSKITETKTKPEVKMNWDKLKSPNTFLLIFLLIILTAMMTYLLPGGEYQFIESGGRKIVDPQSYRTVPGNPQGIGAILKAPIRGFIAAAQIIGFVLLVGGAFSVLQKTETIDVAIRVLANAHQHSPLIRKAIIPVFMIIFSLAGAVFGMSEEVIPFVLLFIPLALALGYDTVTGVAIPFVGAAAGFASAFINPFTLGVAQGIAQLPPLSGFGYRFFCWTLTTGLAILYVNRYALKIKNAPQKSITFEQDQKRKQKLHIENMNSELSLDVRHKTVLIIFTLSMFALVAGVMLDQWYINEIAALFVATGIIVGIVGRLSVDEITGGFIQGAKDLMGTAFVIALARGILIIAQDGKIIGTILHGLSSIITGVHPVVAAQLMFVVQMLINFFIPSGSGQAALTIPIMAPLSDLLGVSRQTAVLAFQFGDGFSNLIIPTSAVTMGVLALAEIPWEKWVKWILPLEILFIILSLVLLIPPFFINW